MKPAIDVTIIDRVLSKAYVNYYFCNKNARCCFRVRMIRKLFLLISILYYETSDE